MIGRLGMIAVNCNVQAFFALAAPADPVKLTLIKEMHDIVRSFAPQGASPPPLCKFPPE